MFLSLSHLFSLPSNNANSSKWFDPIQSNTKIVYASYYSMAIMATEFKSCLASIIWE